jgi:hypothetical protein
MHPPVCRYSGRSRNSEFRSSHDGSPSVAGAVDGVSGRPGTMVFGRFPQETPVRTQKLRFRGDRAVLSAGDRVHLSSRRLICNPDAGLTSGCPLSPPASRWPPETCPSRCSLPCLPPPEAPCQGRSLHRLVALDLLRVATYSTLPRSCVIPNWRGISIHRERPRHSAEIPPSSE